MREIKFRGERFNSVFLNDNFIYGYYYYCSWKVHKHWIRVQKDNHFIDIAIKEETIGQYTGLKDKNGKEIYEGDILETHNQNNIVKYKEGSFRLIGLHKDLYERNYKLLQGYLVDATLRNMKSNFDGVTTTLEIVGNIHQNKELLGNDN